MMALYTPPIPVRRGVSSRTGSIGAGVISAAGAACVLFWLLLPYLSFHERFRRSRKELDAYAHFYSAVGARALAKPPAQIGYFRVAMVEEIDHGFLFRSDFGGPFDWDGLAWSQTKLVEYQKNSRGDVTEVFEPIEGGWYTVFRP